MPNEVGGYTAMRRKKKSAIGAYDCASKLASELLVGDYIEAQHPDDTMELDWVVTSITRSGNRIEVTLSALPTFGYEPWVKTFKPADVVFVLPHNYLKPRIQAEIRQLAGLA